MWPVYTIVCPCICVNKYVTYDIFSCNWTLWPMQMRPQQHAYNSLTCGLFHTSVTYIVDPWIEPLTINQNPVTQSSKKEFEIGTQICDHVMNVDKDVTIEQTHHHSTHNTITPNSSNTTQSSHTFPSSACTQLAHHHTTKERQLHQQKDSQPATTITNRKTTSYHHKTPPPKHTKISPTASRDLVQRCIPLADDSKSSTQSHYQHHTKAATKSLVHRHATRDKIWNG